MKNLFSPEMGKVEVQIDGVNESDPLYVSLFWITFREEIFEIFLIVSGDARIWREAEWLHSASEKKQFIINILSSDESGPSSLRQFFFWRPPNTDNRVLEALLKKVQALEIKEEV